MLSNDGSVLQEPVVVRNKSIPFRTFMHYLDKDASKELTVFGGSRSGLHYNYEDRLYGGKWTEGLRIASEQANKGSARFYEIALNHFHGVSDVDLQHVVLGCNRSNGHSYLVFGYTYKG